MKKLTLSFLPALLLSITAMAEEGFKPLFNGKDLTGWHLRNKDGHLWTVQDGVLKNDLKSGNHGTDLVTDAKFWNFTVRYEYLVPQDSNSGFYLRGRHEIQILGDAHKGQPDKSGDGAIYGHTIQSVYASKSNGEWNVAEATIIGDKVTFTLNGKKIHDNVTVERSTGGEIDNNVTEPGPISLQGDHGVVSFRNMEIKELPKP